MNIYLLRHGLAVESGAPGFAHDSSRPLTPKGRRKMCKVVGGMKELKLSFDLILSSPYIRARQTAEIVARRLKLSRKLQLSETLQPDGSFGDLVKLLNGCEPVPDSVLLVGHEPYLSELISLLVAGEKGIRVVMKKGGLCQLSTDKLKHGQCAALDWLLTPRQLAAMA